MDLKDAVKFLSELPLSHCCPNFGDPAPMWFRGTIRADGDSYVFVSEGSGMHNVVVLIPSHGGDVDTRNGVRITFRGAMGQPAAVFSQLGIFPLPMQQ